MLKHLAAISFVLMLLSLAVYSQRQPPAPSHQYNLSNITTIQETKTYQPVIDKINSFNRSVRSVQSHSLNIQTDHRLARLSGFICYEKPSNFRLVINSQRGKEIDFGSNPKTFWFWSRRYQRGTLFYCAHQEAIKSRLKSPFNPVWMMRSLGLETLDTKNCRLGLTSTGKLVVMKNAKDFQGRDVVVVTLIDQSIPAIIGTYLYSSGGDLIASTEAVKFQGQLPVRWKFMCAEDDTMYMQMEMIKFQVNSPIDTSTWQLPHCRKTVNMATD